MSPANRLLSTSLLLGALLAGCATPPPAPVAPADTTTPAQRIATIEKIAGGDDDAELSVQPLRNPQVDDLREVARTRRAAGDVPAAIAAIDRALALVNGDPGVLQERAELALLQGDYAGAERWSQQALDLGSKTGPLCRRHWATIEQARLARGEKENAASAHAQIEGCTVPGIKRY